MMHSLKHSLGKGFIGMPIWEDNKIQLTIHV